MPESLSSKIDRTYAGKVKNMEAPEKIYALVKTMPTEQVNEVLDFVEFLQQKTQSISQVVTPANKIPKGTLTGLRGIATTNSTPLTDEEIEEDYTNYLQHKYQ